MDYMYQEDTPPSNEKDLVRTSDTNRGGPDYINSSEDDEFMLVNSMKKREQEFYGDEEPSDDDGAKVIGTIDEEPAEQECDTPDGNIPSNRPS